MARATQISAFVSEETKAELDRFVRATGMKKGFVIEQALRNHLRALREIPPEFAIPTQVVLTRESFEEVVREMERPKPPPPDLVKLMKGKRVSDRGLH
jgi:hypothetical protein